MKNILQIIAAFSIFLTGLSNAAEIWTWKPGGPKSHHTLHGIAMHSSGAGAFVVGEFDAIKGPIDFKVVWLNKSGKTIMNRKIDWFWENAETALGDYPASFTISFLGPNAIAVYPTWTNGDDYKVRIYKLDHSGIPKLTLVNSSNALIFGENAFPGWVEKQSKSKTFTHSISGFDQYYEDLESLTAKSL